MPHISVHLLSKDIPDDSPLWEKYAWRVRATRLDSLRLDPGSFISTYESESKQPIEFTIGRLKEPEAWTILVVRTPNEEASKSSDALLHDETEYLGFCVMIDVRKPSPTMIEREGSDRSNAGEDWFMAAVYIDRSIRGTGAGKKMIQFGLDTIRKLSRESGTESAVCVTNVVHGNNNALALYKKLGFDVIDEDEVEEKEGRVYHTTKLRLIL
jgi:ribosomal protein S18 acetylase RimI-like enzyme